MKLDQIDATVLQKAIEIYLSVAYPRAPLPERIEPLARLKSLPEGARGESLLAWEGFEKESDTGPSAAPRRFQLRLGNNRYPHMKLSIDRIDTGEQYVFEVDTHDRHLAPEMMSTRLQETQRHNEVLKRHIETCWDEAGIDTARGRLQAFSEKETGRGGASLTADAHYALLVDDDPDILDVERLLVEAEGLCPLLASNAGEVADQIKSCKGRVNLALIDIMMPGKSGYDIVEELKKGGKLEGPVLFLTAMMGSQVRRGLADAVLHKPFAIDDLRRAIKRALGKPGSA